jgi:hypothetical protein
VSYIHVNYVRDHSKTRGAARLLLVMIASRTREDGIAYASYAHLNKDTGMPVRSIRKALAKIPSDELQTISKGGPQKDGTRAATMYRIIIPEKLSEATDCAPGAHNTKTSVNAHCAPEAHNIVRLGRTPIIKKK